MVSRQSAHLPHTYHTGSEVPIEASAADTSLRGCTAGRVLMGIISIERLSLVIGTVVELSS
jgi:hypothetical protein